MQLVIVYIFIGFALYHVVISLRNMIINRSSGKCDGCISSCELKQLKTDKIRQHQHTIPM